MLSILPLSSVPTIHPPSPNVFPISQTFQCFKHFVSLGLFFGTVGFKQGWISSIKGLFTYYVSQICEFLDPPPPFSAIVIICQAPLTPLSYDKHFLIIRQAFICFGPICRGRVTEYGTKVPGKQQNPLLRQKTSLTRAGHQMTF